jgi:hypothetical protein
MWLLSVLLLAACSTVLKRGHFVYSLGYDDAQEPNSGLNDLQYPEDVLWENPGDIYSMTPGLLPSPRVKNTMTYVDPLVIVFGGYSTDGSFLDDINIYDTRFRKWSGVVLKRRCCNYDGDIFESMGATESNISRRSIADGQEGDLPVARAEHASTDYGGMMYTFGGNSEDYGIMNDFYYFDPIELQWYVLNYYQGPSPPRRAGHNLVTDYDTGILYLFGGRGESGSNVTALNDVWAFDVTSKAWSCASADPATQHARTRENSGLLFEEPIGRQHAAAALINGIMFINGGIDPFSKLIYNDVWAFYTAEKRWVHIQEVSGSAAGYSPPPLYHSFFIPVQTGEGTNSTGFESTNLLLFGGVGGGGSCGGLECGQVQTSLGQVYRLPINYGTYDLDNSSSPSSLAPIIKEGFADNGLYAPEMVRSEIAVNYLALDGTEWSFSRLSDASDATSFEASGNVHAGRGRLLKTWALESACYDKERGILYELGGIQAVDIDFAKNYQSARERVGPTSLDTGNHLGGMGDSTGVNSASGAMNSHPGPDADGKIYDDANAPLWDVETEQHLRTATQLPVNAAWQFEDAFQRSQPQQNNTLRFMQVFRTYTVVGAEARDITLQTVDNQGTVP